MANERGHERDGRSAAAGVGARSNRQGGRFKPPRRTSQSLTRNSCYLQRRGASPFLRAPAPLPTLRPFTQHPVRNRERGRGHLQRLDAVRIAQASTDLRGTLAIPAPPSSDAHLRSCPSTRPSARGLQARNVLKGDAGKLVGHFIAGEVLEAQEPPFDVRGRPRFLLASSSASVMAGPRRATKCFRLTTYLIRASDRIASTMLRSACALAYASERGRVFTHALPRGRRLRSAASRFSETLRRWAVSP